MVDLRIEPGKAWHCGALARRLRHEHRDSLAIVNIDIHRELRAMFDSSSFRKAGFLDGKLSGLWGVSGSLSNSVGYVWVALTEEARKYPILIYKEAQKQLAEMMKTRHEMVTTVLPSDMAATRFAVSLGFHAGHEGRGAPAFSRFSRLDLVDYLSKTPEIRQPIGNGFCVSLGYHAD